MRLWPSRTRRPARPIGDALIHESRTKVLVRVDHWPVDDPAPTMKWAMTRALARFGGTWAMIGSGAFWHPTVAGRIVSWWELQQTAVPVRDRYDYRDRSHRY